MLDSAEELHDQIIKVIGSSEYRAILNGRELHLRGEPQKTLTELGFSGPAMLMVQKRPTENGQATEPAVRGIFNSVEAEILKHFDELYEMLDSREPQGFMVGIPPSAVDIQDTLEADCFRYMIYFDNSHRSPRLKVF